MHMDPAVRYIYTYLLKYGARISEVKKVGNNGYIVRVEMEEYRRYSKEAYWSSIGSFVLVPQTEIPGNK